LNPLRTIILGIFGEKSIAMFGENITKHIAEGV
jgi:hypothetical protein